MPDDYPLTASAGGTTDDGHLMARKFVVLVVVRAAR